MTYVPRLVEIPVPDDVKAEQKNTPIKPMSPEQMEEWATAMRQASRENFERSGDLMPVFMVLSRNGEVSIVATPDGMTNQESKDALADFIRKFAVEHSAVAVLFMSEAWISSVAPGERRRYQMPADDPKRREALIAVLDTAVGSRQWTAEIDRSSDAPFVKEWVEMAGAALSGRFVNFLQKAEGEPQ